MVEQLERANLKRREESILPVTVQISLLLAKFNTILNNFRSKGQKRGFEDSDRQNVELVTWNPEKFRFFFHIK